MQIEIFIMKEERVMKQEILIRGEEMTAFLGKK